VEKRLTLSLGHSCRHIHRIREEEEEEKTLEKGGKVVSSREMAERNKKINGTEKW
jgi:hypothetical protein